MIRMAILAFTMLLPVAAAAQKVAITFDDLPLNGKLQPGMAQAEIVRQTLAVLKARRVPTTYGFVNAHRFEGNADGALALQLWVAGGQRVGNHTYSHINLTTASAEDFIRDVQQNEPVLLLLARDDHWRWLRYPYLREGDTLEKRRAVRKLLSDRGYAIAQTTIDYEDYLWNSAYARCVERHDDEAIAWLRSSYLQLAAAYFDASRSMALTVFGREINHVLLLHLGAFTPDILPRLLDLMERTGFEFVTLEEAQRDPAYESDPDLAASRGGTLLEQHMDARQLKYPPVLAKPSERLAAICG